MRSPKRVVEAVFDAVNSQLTVFPESGRIGRVEGTLELVVASSPSIVPYRIKGDVIEVLSSGNLLFRIN
jgi:toxin ParE1/3/4